MPFYQLVRLFVIFAFQVPYLSGRLKQKRYCGMSIYRQTQITEIPFFTFLSAL